MRVYGLYLSVDPLLHPLTPMNVRKPTTKRARWLAGNASSNVIDNFSVSV